MGASPLNINQVVRDSDPGVVSVWRTVHPEWYASNNAGAQIQGVGAGTSNNDFGGAGWGVAASRSPSIHIGRVSTTADKLYARMRIPPEFAQATQTPISGSESVSHETRNIKLQLLCRGYISTSTAEFAASGNGDIEVGGHVLNWPELEAGETGAGPTPTAAHPNLGSTKKDISVRRKGDASFAATYTWEMDDVVGAGYGPTRAQTDAVDGLMGMFEWEFRGTTVAINADDDLWVKFTPNLPLTTVDVTAGVIIASARFLVPCHVAPYDKAFR